MTDLGLTILILWNGEKSVPLHFIFGNPNDMEGFILAAGLGTRLRPLTNDRPKALVEIDGVALLEMAIHRLEEAGIGHIVVNVHHFGEKVIDFIASHRWQARIDISDERPLLLDTGGGLKKAAPLFSGKENVLVHNVDILSEIDLRDVERRHREEGNLATLCVSLRDTKRLLLFDETGRLAGRYPSPSHPATQPHTGLQRHQRGGARAVPAAAEGPPPLPHHRRIHPPVGRRAPHRLLPPQPRTLARRGQTRNP